MDLNRREFVGAGVSVATVLALLPGIAAAEGVEDAINAFTGGAEAGSEGITLIAPEIAENGNTVPIEVEAPGAEAIVILAAGNPQPGVCTAMFGPAAGQQMCSTRIRLAGEQDVIAIARMPDGTFLRAQQEVKVTIGGCGG